MATYTVSTSQNYTAVNGGTFNDHDRITVNSGAKLTINTDTNMIERLLCISLGEVYVENLSTTTPIFLKFGDNGASGNGQIRFEGGGVLRGRGAWISLGTSDGTADQEFTLPQNASLEDIPLLPAVHVFKDGETDPTIYIRVDTFTDALAIEEGASFFIHDTVNNKIIFGDDTNGSVPENLADIRIPNIHCTDGTTGSGYTDFDLATSGKIDLDKMSWGANFAFNFSSASKIDVKNSGFEDGREIFNIGSQQNPLMEHCGVRVSVNSSGALQASASNNFTLRNIFIYNTNSTTNYHGFYLTNGANGIIDRCRVSAPNQASSNSRSCFYMTSPNLTFTDCYAFTQGVGFNFGAGSGSSTLTGCRYNGQALRGKTVYGTYAVSSANSSGNIFIDFGSALFDSAHGAVPPNTYFISASTGTSNWTVHDCDFYVGDTTTGSRTNNPIFSNGTGHRFNKIRIHGDFSGDTINHSTASADTSVSNVTFMNSEVNANDIEWTDGSNYDLVASPDNIDTVPSASGSDVRTLHLRETNSTTAGRLFKPFGSHPSSGSLTEHTITGNYFFDNAGKLYMDTSGDMLEFESNVHGGITAFTNVVLSGSGTGSWNIQFKFRVPNGAYGTYADATTANLNTALSALTGYDSNEGLQIMYKVERTASSVANYLNHIRFDTTIDVTYEAPFEVYPTYINFTGLTSGDVIYIDDASHTEKLFMTSDGTDFSMILPNDNDGETWKYAVKRVGYEYQKGDFTIAEGVDVGVAVNLLQKVQPVGGAMYTGSSNIHITIDIDLVTPQFSVDISDDAVTAQNVLDAVENALITRDGMSWICREGTDINFANLGGAGSFLFFEDNIRVRRASAGDNDAEIGAYVFSTDGTNVDEVNGTVKLFSGTIVNDFLQSQLDLGGGSSMALETLFQVLASMVELETTYYRFKEYALETAGGGLDETGLHTALDNYSNKDDFKADISTLNNLSAAQVATEIANALSGGVTLTTPQVNAIAVAIEAAIINEGDGQQVIDAIVQAIGNENITAATIAEAVWDVDLSAHTTTDTSGASMNDQEKILGWLRSLL